MSCLVCLAILAASPALSTDLVRHTTDGLDKQRPCWSPDGKTLLFARHESGGSAIRLYLLRRGDPARLLRLTDRKSPEYNGAFSPDGKAIAFAAITLSGTQGNLDIARVTPEGQGLTTLTDDHGRLVHQDWPSFSPDGARFAFSSTHDGNQEIYSAKADGTDLVRLTQHPGLDTHPCWSPDGQSIAFSTDRWGGLELATVKPDGTGLTRLTDSRGLDDYPAFSPDGRALAFVTHRDGQFEVYLCDADGQNPRNLSEHPGRDTFPCWTPDGLGVTYVSERGGGIDLYTRLAIPTER